MYGRKYYSTQGINSGGSGNGGSSTLDIDGIVNTISQLKVDIKTLQASMQNEIASREYLSDMVSDLDDRVTALETRIPNLIRAYTKTPALYFRRGAE